MNGVDSISGGVVCVACGGGNSVEFPYIDADWSRTDTFRDLSIIVCVECGFGSVNPEPSDEELTRYYETYYRDETSPYHIDFARQSNDAFQNFFDARSISQISLATMFTDFVQGSTFLDLGPGLGLSFGSAKKMLRQPNLFAVDPNLDSKHYYERVYGASCGSLDEFIDGGRKAQIALMSHSLEHFSPSRLASVLAKLHACLAPEGALVIEVPFDDLRDNFDVAQPQTPHVSFFSLDGLKQVLAVNGWDVVYMSQCATPLQQNANDPVESKAVSQISKTRKYVVKHLPPFGLKVARALKAASVQFRGSSQIGALDSFVYGSERDCIRVVVRSDKN